MKRSVKAIIIAAAVLIAAGCTAGGYAFYKYAPGKKKADLTEYYGLKKGEAAVILQDQQSSEKALVRDGQIFLNINTVKNYINKRFYYDYTENVLIYTTADTLVKAEPDSAKYSVNKSGESFEDPVCTVEEENESSSGTGRQAYVNIDFVKKYSRMDYKHYKNPDRVVIQYDFDKNETFRKAEKKAALRWRAGIKSEVLCTLEKGDSVLVTDDKADTNGYIKAMSLTGETGYVKKNRLGSSYTKKYKNDQKEETYSHLLMDETPFIGFHQVTSSAGNSSIDSILTKNTGLNVIAPTWFQADGTEGEIRSYGDYSYVDKVHNAGMQVWGVVDDFADNNKIGEILSATSRRQRLEKNILAAAIKYSLDGVNIDFENVKKANGEDFIQFIRELGIMCRTNGLVLSIDNYPLKNYNEYYDRAEQAAVADYVITMAYDEDVTNKKPGPASSLVYVKSSASDVLKEVPEKQSVIALPFYSRLWITDKKGKYTSRAYGMSGAADALKEAGSGKISWDDKTSMNYEKVQDKEGNTYEIWIEDQRSLLEKMNAVKSIGSAGYAFWKLGLESDGIWQSLTAFR